MRKLGRDALRVAAAPSWASCRDEGRNSVAMAEDEVDDQTRRMGREKNTRGPGSCATSSEKLSRANCLGIDPTDTPAVAGVVGGAPLELRTFNGGKVV